MIICFEFYIVLTKGLSDLVLPFIYRDYIKYLLYFYTILLKTTKTNTLTRPAASRSPPPSCSDKNKIKLTKRAGCLIVNWLVYSYLEVHSNFLLLY